MPGKSENQASLRRQVTATVAVTTALFLLPGWTGVTYITGGSHNLGALRGDGEPLSSHASSRWSGELRLVDLAVNTAVAAGLRADGTVISLGADTESWTDVTAVSASGAGVLGLRRDGSVYGSFFREGGALDAASLTEVTAMAAGSTHSAFVHRDGTVTVLGDTTMGQGNTASWRLTDG